MSSAAPLAGLTVVELGASVAAPAAAQILGDLGADIVKVEKPEGDDARKWGPPFVDGASATFQSLNRNKRSVVCDLRDDTQRESLVRFIVERADVVLQNLRPGQVDLLGLGATTLLARQPRLIYCNMGAFGNTGPLSKRPGYDPLMQAFGGIMSMVGEEGRPPVRVGPSIVDVGTAFWAVIGIQSLLFRRMQTGRGGVVDVSLFETAAGWMSMFAAQYLASGEVPRKTGSGQTAIVPYRAFATADGDVVVAAANNMLFKRLCAVLGQPHWCEDVRFGDNPARVTHAGILNGMIEVIMRQQTTAHWVDAFDAAGVPCAPVQHVGQMLEHEQLQALGLLQQVPGSSIPLIGMPLSIDGVRPVPRMGPPTLGQHTKDIL